MKTETAAARNARYNAATVANAIASLVTAHSELSGLHEVDASPERDAILETIQALADLRRRVAADAGVEVEPLHEAREVLRLPNL